MFEARKISSIAVMQHKNAGGYPPALGESPNWETQFDYTIASCELLETLLPELLEEVLLEVAESAKERHIGLSLQMPFELQVGQLDSANVISHLRKAISAGNRILIDNRLAGNARCNGSMYGLGHNALPTVVVNLDGIELLQISQVVKKEDLQIALDSHSKTVEVLRHLLVVDKHLVRNGQMLEKRNKGVKLLFSTLNVLPTIIVVTVNQGVEMEGRPIETVLTQSGLVQTDIPANVKTLLMEYKAHKIKIRNTTHVSGLIDKNGQLFHMPLPSNLDRGTKKCRGTTPGSWRTSYSEDPNTLYHEPERLFNCTQSRTHVLHY